MSRKQNYILLLVCTIICATIVYFQYKSKRDKQIRLETIGVRVNIQAQYSSSWGVDNVHYSFITQRGEKIEASEKCGNNCDDYKNAFAIYNPAVPSEYELSFNFDTYSPSWRIVFFFFIYLPAMIFIVYGFIKFGLAAYLRFKS